MIKASDRVILSVLQMVSEHCAEKTRSDCHGCRFLNLDEGICEIYIRPWLWDIESIKATMEAADLNAAGD